MIDATPNSVDRSGHALLREMLRQRNQSPERAAEIDREIFATSSRLPFAPSRLRVHIFPSDLVRRACDQRSNVRNVFARYPLPMLTAWTWPTRASAGKWLWPLRARETLGNSSSSSPRRGLPR